MDWVSDNLNSCLSSATKLMYGFGEVTFFSGIHFSRLYNEALHMMLPYALLQQPMIRR